MKFILSVVFISAFTTITAQDNKSISGNKTDTFYSTILKEPRFIRIYVPNSVSSPGAHCPVIYILDGEVHFFTVIDILKKLSKETGDAVYSQTMVVAIGNLWERDRDYTPTHIISSPFVDSTAAAKSGGGEKFISFLEKELIPYVESRYPASGSRMLMGHSLGGLTVINALVHHTKLFAYYMAIDPSMWWDDQTLLKQTKNFFGKNTLKGTSLFLAVANTMNKDMEDTSQIKKDNTGKTALIRPSLYLVDYINVNKAGKLRFDWKYYKEQNHLSVPPAATYDGLKFLLKAL